jgi:hypothetical protein
VRINWWWARWARERANRRTVAAGYWPAAEPAAVSAGTFPVVSTAHAELYDYEEPDDAEPGLRP